MCGIVLAGGNLFASDVGLFEKLLFCDTFRGDHSTGVIAGYHHLGAVSAYTAKAAVAAPEFLKSQLWADVSKRKIGASLTAVSPKFLIGHNRYATRGAKTAENAHPFTHGHISLVHNGTLIDQSLLPEHNRFQVDSENIAYAISVNGAADTIQKLNGAFTLIWYDSQQNTVNIIRNDDRPFHLAEAVCGDWFGASEEEMLLWILGRDDKYSISRTSPKIKRHFECEVGTQYVFDVSKGSFKLVEEIKHELPVFPAKTYYSYSGYGYTGAGTIGGHVSHQRTFPTVTRPTYTADLSNGVLDRFCVPHKLGDYINFSAYDFKAYSHTKHRGSMSGYLPETPSFVDVVHHGIDVGNYEQFAEYRGKIVSAYEPNENGKPSGYLNIIVTDVSKIRSFEETLQAEEDEHKSGLVSDPLKKVASAKDEGLGECCSLSSSTVIDAEKIDTETGEVLEVVSEKTKTTLPAVIPDKKGGEVHNPFVSTDDGAWYSRSSWESSSVSTCLSCKSQIPFAEMDLAVSHGGGYHCWRCDDNISSELDDGGAVMSASSHKMPYSENWMEFVCTGCGERRSYVDESDTTDLCNDCYESYYCAGHGYRSKNAVEEETKLVGGVDQVTKSQWSATGVCSKCASSIPWEDCEHVSYQDGDIVCLNCVDL